MLSSSDSSSLTITTHHIPTVRHYQHIRLPPPIPDIVKMTEGGSLHRFHPVVASPATVTSSHHRRSRLRLKPPPPPLSADAEAEAAHRRRQASFAQLADTISQSWEDLNDYLQSPSVSIAKLHLETLALMRGLHGDRPLDREGMHGRQKDRGSAGAERERDATTARLLALGSQLNGIRDNLTQVLASSHLMIQAAGDIDLELDVSSDPPLGERTGSLYAAERWVS